MKTKKELIAQILTASNIYHNISTMRVRLPEAPDGMPDDIFWNTCGDMIQFFKEDWENWQENKYNDTGNRNLCKDCEIKGKVYQHGRMGATLYWDAYWDSSNSGFRFKYDENDLEEKDTDELKTILGDINAFKDAVSGMMKALPDELEYQYKNWQEEDTEKSRRTALGYYRTLENLLSDKNQTVKRHAQGILTALQK